MGYIKLDHELRHWQYYTDRNMLLVWIDLLLRARYTDGYYNGILIKRGQCLVGRSATGRELVMTESEYRGCLKRLKLSQQITTEKTNKGTLVTIINWDKYQGGAELINQQINQELSQRLTNDSPSVNQPLTKQEPMVNHKEEYKELKEYKNSLSLKENKQINNQELPPDLFELFENEFKRPLTQIELQRLSDWSREYDQQLIVYSLREASINNAYSFNYIDKILCEWQRKGMTAEKYEEREIYADE
ncbi:DnaD domain-containing protein [Dielma fastidiosa]|uniref:DnaD domain-containing protein n=1 Tax=Dielma fastidiosa TaxID=1034346 RepID=UPI001FCFA93A|nr:DnaD domain protein [Dielma fastidiosa]